MNSGVRNTLFILFGVVSLTLGLFVYRFLNPGPPSHEQLLNLDYFSFNEPRVIRDIKLIDHNLNSVDIDTFKGKRTLVFFGFTSCPDICPTTLSVLNQAMQELSVKPTVVMVSVDPERDTLEKLASYVPAFNADFIGLTGEFDDIVKLATQLNVAFGKVPGTEPGTYQVSHSGIIALLNTQAEFAGFFKIPHRAENISKVLRIL
jgi:protein SCO1/2